MESHEYFDLHLHTTSKQPTNSKTVNKQTKKASNIENSKELQSGLMAWTIELN